MIPFFHKLRWLLRRGAREAELREELRFHLEEEAEQREAEGLREDEAQRAARRELGNLALVQEATRAVWGWTFLEQLVQDLRYAARAMLHNRAFTALALLSLALGIGANTAIYSFMDSILLRSLPVRDPQSLALLNWHSPPPRGPRPNHVMHGMDGSTWSDGQGGEIGGIFPFGAFELLRENTSVFSSLFAYYPSDKRNLTINGQAEIVSGEFVSGDYFRGLAVPPAAGRLIAADDDRAGAPPVVAISMRLAGRRFANAANAVGQSILIDNQPFTVIGVTPPEFFGVDPAANPDVYLPLHANLALDKTVSWAVRPETFLDRNHYWIEMMGRLRPGMTLAQAQASLAPAFHQWVEATAGNDRERASLPALTVIEGASGLATLRRRYSKPLYVLLAMAGLILAIACANIANLLLARAAARRREMAVRLSIGAGRLRLVRQLLTESVCLAFFGGALGVALAVWGVRILTLLLANGAENFTLRAELNWHVLAATFALSVLCGAVFGLAPAIQSTRAEVMPALKGGRAAEPGWRPRMARRATLSQTLVVSQIVISLLLLVAAGLFVRTLSNLQRIQMGFNRENVLLFQLNARQSGHGDPEILTFYEELRERFAGIPGVRGATLSHASLLGAGRGLEIRVAGKPADRKTRILHTGPKFFSTMQIPMRLGREIDERDTPTSPGVVVANEEFVKVHFGSENPLGRRVTRGGPHPREMEIVGVASNAHYGGLKDDIPPVLYIPYNQEDQPKAQAMVYALRTAGDPLACVKTVRDIVHRADRRIPLVDVRSQAAEIDRTMNQEIVFARLCTAFAILALVIAGVGLYGTTAYGVARRAGEIGIRMALGAQRGVVVRMILRQVLALAALGVAIGLPAALGASRLVRSFLFGMKANDPLALAAAVGILLGAVVIAGYLPARKASRIDPIAALRDE